APPAVASPYAADGVPAHLAGTGRDAAGTGRGTGGGSGDGIGPGDGGVRYARAEWIRMPPPDAMQANWPRESIKRRVPGRVELGCYVPRPGPPRRCWLLSETPKGFGFGKAAMALWGQFRIRPVR
ncbi:hypothetical protein LJD47_33800, partial [Escherichia coli]|nr:hypothetical protein [Escherichia coli]